MSISESRIIPDLLLACMGSSAKEMTITLDRNAADSSP
jgi:hypothetical protein